MANEIDTQEKAGALVDEVSKQLENDVANVVEQAANGDFSSMLPLVEKYLLPIGLALLTVLVGYFIAIFVARLASGPITKRVDETIGKFVRKLIFYSIMIFTILGVLGRFGISVASFAAVIAAAGFAVGLAFQGTLSNFASGVLLLVFRPFKVGDFVNVAGVLGSVAEIDLFTTALNTLDNKRIIVPNSSISGSVIENYSFHPHRRVDVNVGVDYQACLKTTRATLEVAAQSLGEKVLQGADLGFTVNVMDLGDSSVNWQVRVWTKSADFWQVRQELIEAIKTNLDSKGISIPFPQMDVHLMQSSG